MSVYSASNVQVQLRLGSPFKVTITEFISGTYLSLFPTCIVHSFPDNACI